jgi:4-hydroxy-3-methylbut-2-en-1-yl diphosphate synthase IspG/GcpE
MFTINLQDTLSIIVAGMAVLGAVSLAAGIFVLFRKVMGDELRVIASQTARLAQKGITDEITGLVGNASALLEALNSLVKTTTGVGVFLTLIGFILMVVAYYLGLQP